VLCKQAVSIKASTMPELSLLEFIEIVQKFVKVTGFAAYTIENGKPTVKFHDLLLFLFTISAGVFMCFYSWTTIDLKASKSMIIAYGNLLTINASIGIAIYSNISVFVFRRKLLNVLVNYDKMDKKV